MGISSVRLVVISIAALIAVGLTITTSQYASAATSLTCIDTVSGTDVNDIASISPGTSISCTSFTTNSNVGTSLTTVTDGSGTVDTSVPGLGTSAAVAFVAANAGVWHVEVLYYDASGAVLIALSMPIQIVSSPVDSPPDVTGLADSPDPFSPNTNGIKDSTFISFQSNELGTYSIAIKNSVGTTVRTLTGAIAASNTVSWDGMDDSVTPVPDGIYTYFISATDAAGNTRLPPEGGDGSVTVDTSPPLVAFVTPNPSDNPQRRVYADFETAAPGIQLAATATDLNGVAETSFFDVFLVTTTIGTDATAPYNANWIGGALGTHILQMTAVDNAGNSATAEVGAVINAPTVEFGPVTCEKALTPPESTPQPCDPSGKPRWSIDSTNAVVISNPIAPGTYKIKSIDLDGTVHELEFTTTNRNEPVTHPPVNFGLFPKPQYVTDLTKNISVELVKNPTIAGPVLYPITTQPHTVVLSTPSLVTLESGPSVRWGHTFQVSQTIATDYDNGEIVPGLSLTFEGSALASTVGATSTLDGNFMPSVTVTAKGAGSASIDLKEVTVHSAPSPAYTTADSGTGTPASYPPATITITKHRITLDTPTLTVGEGGLVRWGHDYGVLASAARDSDSPPGDSIVGDLTLTFSGNGVSGTPSTMSTALGTFVPAFTLTAPGSSNVGLGRKVAVHSDENTDYLAADSGTGTPASGPAAHIEVAKHRIALGVPVLDLTSPAKVEWGRPYGITATSATDLDVLLAGPLNVAGLTLSYSGSAVDTTGGALTTTSVGSVTGTFADTLVANAPISIGGSSVGTNKEVIAHSDANADYLAADSPAATLEILKRTPVLSLFLPPSVVQATSVTSTGLLTDPYDRTGLENQQITFNTLGASTTTIPSQNTEGIHAQDSVSPSPGLAIELCSLCTNLATGFGTNVLYAHVGATFSLPHDAQAVNIMLQDMGTNSVEIRGVQTDDIEVLPEHPATAPVSDGLIGLTITSDIGLKAFKIYSIAGSDTGPFASGSLPVAGISSIELINSASDPQRTMLLDMGDQTPIPASSPVTEEVSLGGGTYYSIGTATSNVLAGLMVLANYGGNSDYFAAPAATATFKTSVDSLGLSSPGGANPSAGPHGGSIFTTIPCLATDGDNDYDGRCNAGEASGGGIPYTVGGTSYNYYLPTGTSDFATGCGTGGTIADGGAGAVSGTIGATRDVYVQLDSMIGHPADCGAIADVISKFNANGIKLHVARDELNLAHVSILNTWSDSIPDTNIGNSFDEVKAYHFGKSANERPTFTVPASWSTSPTTGGTANTNVVTTANSFTMTLPTYLSTSTSTTGATNAGAKVEGTIFIRNLVTLNAGPNTVNGVDTVTCSCPSILGLTFGTATATAQAALSPANSFLVTIKLPFTYTGATVGLAVPITSVSATMHITTARTGTTSDGSTNPDGTNASPYATTSYLNAQAQIFRYAYWAHDGVATCGPSGFGEFLGNDILITLGCGWSGTESGSGVVGTVGSRNEQAGTFMHELGHTLNLGHGGPLNLFGALRGTQGPAIVAAANAASTSITKSFTVGGVNLYSGSAIPATIAGPATVTMKVNVNFVSSAGAAMAPGTITPQAMVAPTASSGITPTIPTFTTASCGTYCRTFISTTTVSATGAKDGTAAAASIGTFTINYRTSAAVMMGSVANGAATPTISMPSVADSGYNCKPNYPSVMSYTRQVDRTYLIAANWLLDLSHGYFYGATPSVNEAALLETAGLRSSSSTAGATTTPKIVYSISGGTGFLIADTTTSTAPTATSIDWSGDGPIQTITLPTYDINKFTPIAGCDSGTGALYNDYDDWHNITIKFNDDPDGANGQHGPAKKYNEIPPGQAKKMRNMANAFGGVEQPVNADGSSEWKLGRTVPVKFALSDADGIAITTGNFILAAEKKSDAVEGNALETVVAAGPADTGQFRFDGNKWAFNLGTGPGTQITTKGTYALTIYQVFTEDGIEKRAPLYDLKYTFKLDGGKGMQFTVPISFVK